MKALPNALILCTALVAGCKEKAQEPKIELPAATQEGKETGGCFIDGEAWRNSPTSGLFGSATGMFALVNKKAGQNTYVISIGISSDNPSREVSFRCLKATGVGIYPFTVKVPAHGPVPEPDYARYRNNSGNGPKGEFITGPTATGQLEITYFDLQKNVIAGRFFFVGQDSVSSRRVSLSDGRFDTKFAYMEFP